MNSAKALPLLHQVPLWTAVVTPFNAQGNVDVKSLEELLLTQNQAENGVLLLGSTGESLSLSLEEKKEILSLACSLKLQVPIMVGIGGTNLRDSLHWMDYLETLPLTSYLMVTPLYSKPGIRGMGQWFKTLLQATSRPSMLYNIPSRTGAPLHHQSLAGLSELPNLWAIKEAGGDIAAFQKYLREFPRIQLYSGDDGDILAHAQAGAKGLVSVASNFWPRETHQIVLQALNGKLTPKQNSLWQQITRALFVATNPIPIKRLLFEGKKIECPAMRLPLTQEDLPDYSPLTAAMELMIQLTGDLGLKDHNNQ